MREWFGGDFDGRNEVGNDDLLIEIGGSRRFSSRRYYLRWSFSVGVALLLGWRCEGKKIGRAHV